MQRVALLVLALFVVWKLLSVFGKRQARRSAGADDFSRFSAKRRDHRQRMRESVSGAGEELVACARCGTWVPTTRAVLGHRGEVCCSAACAAAEPVVPGDPRSG